MSLKQNDNFIDHQKDIINQLIDDGEFGKAKDHAIEISNKELYSYVVGEENKCLIS